MDLVGLYVSESGAGVGTQLRYLLAGCLEETEGLTS